MNSIDREIKVLYLGPKSRGGVYTSDLDEQSNAAKEMGAEFVIYEGSSDGELIEALKDADVAMHQGHGIDPKLFTQMGNNGRCKGLVSFGHGYDGMDLNSAVQNGVILANTASFGTEEVSNQTMMHFLICSRKFVLHDKLMKSGTWTREYLSPMGHISGETLGLIGIGDIGRAVSRKAKAFAKKKGKAKMSSMFKKKFGFQNLYDNQTLCENLEEDEFAKFYLIAFVVLMGYLLYKATEKRR